MIETIFLFIWTMGWTANTLGIWIGIILLAVIASRLKQLIRAIRGW